MFQYAAAKALAERHGARLALDLTSLRDDPLRSFQLERFRIPEAATGEQTASYFFYRGRWQARAHRMMARVGMPGIRPSERRYREPSFHFDTAFEQLGSHILLFGYFQSERYFAAISDELRALFTPREQLSAAARSTAERIARSSLSVSVHVRRGDYTKATNAAIHGILDNDYYVRALGLLKDRLGREPDIFVFSDDPAAAGDALRLEQCDRITYVIGDPHRPWEDMTLMASCRHHVIANSSFSWWGAWLNRSSDKMVVAPRAWFSPQVMRKQNTCDLYPSEWILV